MVKAWHDGLGGDGFLAAVKLVIMAIENYALQADNRISLTRKHSHQTLISRDNKLCQ